MDGQITQFDDESQSGEITARDGSQYCFGLSDWRGRGLPSANLAVRFEPREDRAVQVFNLPAAQQKARKSIKAGVASKASSSTEQKPVKKQLSHWSLAALVVSLAGYSAKEYAFIIEIVALVLAWVGLRHIHKNSTQYNGTWISALAIVIAVIVTLWTQR